MRTVDKFNRLPHWAQDEITRLNNVIVHKETEIQALTGTTPTRVELDPYREYAGGSHIYMPDHTTIRFHTKFGRVDAYVRGGVLEITLLGYDRYPLLAVIPHASNKVSIQATE